MTASSSQRASVRKRCKALGPKPEPSRRDSRRCGVPGTGPAGLGDSAGYVPATACVRRPPRSRHGTRGLGWRESVGQPLGCPEGGLGIDGAVRLQGEWVNRPLLTLRFPALSLWPRLRPQQPATHWAMPSC